MKQIAVLHLLAKSSEKSRKYTRLKCLKARHLRHSLASNLPNPSDAQILRSAADVLRWSFFLPLFQIFYSNIQIIRKYILDMWKVYRMKAITKE